MTKKEILRKVYKKLKDGKKVVKQKKPSKNEFDAQISRITGKVKKVKNKKKKDKFYEQIRALKAGKKKLKKQKRGK